MTKVIMHGCNGKMGQTITEMCKDDPEIEIVAGFCNANRVCFNSSQTMAYLKFIINRGISS